MSEIKYLFDEHVNPRLRKALKQLAPDIVVWRIGDPGTPHLGTLDPESTPEEVEETRARLFQEMEPPRPLPPGKTLADILYGKWPGDETGEEVLAALEKLS